MGCNRDRTGNREGVESPSLEVFKDKLKVAPSAMVWFMGWCSVSGWSPRSQRSFPIWWTVWFNKDKRFTGRRSTCAVRDPLGQTAPLVAEDPISPLLLQNQPSSTGGSVQQFLGCWRWGPRPGRSSRGGSAPPSEADPGLSPGHGGPPAPQSRGPAGESALCGGVSSGPAPLPPSLDERGTPPGPVPPWAGTGPEGCQGCSAERLGPDRDSRPRPSFSSAAPRELELRGF